VNTRYQFGDGDLASRRLALLAETFRPTTERFLREAGPAGVGRAVDLGCGPGYTTASIMRVLSPQNLAGVDASAAFLDEARRRVPTARFIEGDVVEDLAVYQGAGLVFARYLLSHLPDGEQAIRLWADRLGGDGVLLLEELEAIEPVHAPFAEYLGVVEALLADHGMPLYVGRDLAESPDPPGCERFFDRALRFEVEASRAAQMFRMNVPNWRRRPFIESRYGTSAIDGLIERLNGFAESSAARENPRWTLRQIGWRKRTPAG